jgi:hypothetical protein
LGYLVFVLFRWGGMERRVELFAAIRFDWQRYQMPVRALARKYDVHRRTVRQAIASPVPVSSAIASGEIERSSTSRPRHRPGAKMGSRSARSRQGSGGV